MSESRAHDDARDSSVAAAVEGAEEDEVEAASATTSSSSSSVPAAAPRQGLRGVAVEARETVALGRHTCSIACWPEWAIRRRNASSLSVLDSRGVSSWAPLIESTMSPTHSSLRSSSTSCASEMCSSRMVPSPGE